MNLPVRQRRIGYLSQQPALFPHLSVRQNVEYGLLDLPRPERDSRVDCDSGALSHPALAASRPAAISGGEQQRVALARTLVCEPELLLLDEPLSALDLRLKSLLLEALFDWQRERAVPMLYVTHEQSEAYSLSRRVLVMEDGTGGGRRRAAPQVFRCAHQAASGPCSPDMKISSMPWWKRLIPPLAP